MEKSKGNSMNEVFLQKLTEAVFANLNNEQFGAEQLAKEVGISRSQIHRKLEKINGKSITKFIREIRLEEALRLLRKEVGTASEISYQVGFSSPTYFNKCFHEYFGYPPGEVKKLKEISPEIKKSLEEYDRFRAEKMDKIPPPSKSGQADYTSTTFLKNKLPYLIIPGLIIIIGAVLIWYLTKERPSQVIEKSIAVLPFKNIGGSDENQLLCDGMLEEIVNNLQYISDLNVICRTSVEQYKTPSIDIKKIAKELEVGNILEGSIRMYGTRFRINVQLIQTGTGFNLWSDVFDGVLSDTIFIVQSSIAQKIAMKLNAVITPREKQQIEKVPTSNYKAYEKYIQGQQFLWEFWSINNREDIVMAEKLFREALEIDPEFAMGYSGLAEIYIYKNNHDSAVYYSDKIIEYDPNNSYGYALKGFCNWYSDKALKFYKKALELDPNNPQIYYDLGWAYYFTGLQDYPRSISYLKKSEDLWSKQKAKKELASNHARMGEIYRDIGDYEKAKQHYETSLEIYPMCWVSYQYCWLLIIDTGPESASEMADSLLCNISTCEDFCYILKSYALYMSGKISQAEAYLRLSIEVVDILTSPIRDSLLTATIYKELGREQEASAILYKTRLSIQNELKEGDDWMLYLSLSQIHAMLDEKEKALMSLSKAADLGLQRGWLDLVEIYPPFESLREDPEFKAIIKKAQEKKAAMRAQLSEMEERGELGL